MKASETPSLRPVLADCLKQKRRLLFWLFLALLAGGAMEAYPVRLMQRALDTIIAYGSWRAVLSLVVMWYGCRLLGAAAQYASGALSGRLGAVLGQAVQSHVFDRMRATSVSRLEALSASEAVARTANDTAELGEVIVRPIRIIGRNSLIFAWSLVFLIQIDAVLLMTCLPLGALMLVVGDRVSRLQKTAAAGHKRHYTRTVACLIETIAASRELAVFNLWDRQTELFRRASEGVAVARRSSTRFGSALTSLVDALWPMATVTCLLLGGYRVIAGQLTPGGLMAFMWYVQWVIHPLSQIASYQAEVQSSLVAAARVQELLDWLVTDETLTTPVVMHESLDIEALAFAYGDDTVLHHVDLTVKPGEVVALVGKTGSGKSTILKLALGLLESQSGRIMVDGWEVDAAALRGSPSFAAVFQQPFLFPDLSVRENVLIVADSPADAEQALIDANAMALADCARVDTLSGGQRQRVALARALARRPAVLILDEATAAVDSATEDEICQALFRRREKDGLASIIVSHRLSTIINADRIYLIHEGRVNGCGTHQQLLASCPEYRLLYGTQMSLEV